VARRDGARRVERRVFPATAAKSVEAALVEALQMLQDETRAA
jgi:hypothetical protein